MSGWSRRSFLGAAALVAVQAAVPGGAAVLAKLDPKDAPSPRRRKLMRTVADHVIPATDTPGAGAVGAGDFVLVALAHGLEGTRRPPAADPSFAPYLRADGSLDHAAWLEARLGPKWLTLPSARRHEALAALDATAFKNDPAAAPWRAIKGLILTGYYTSEIGGSKELNYELVPGRFDPKVPVTPETRAYSSDWTAVDFG
ncbi:MAG: gluconate 2-dehydrogenase subunit 3 family protein [Novosphingobium sp.]|uniref:gluconate 2-dehydrogenase subunit 3 family protein n=1 Tax=Novosphingobium sp. TaxID=1874826 RepID=UPI00301A3032